MGIGDNIVRDVHALLQKPKYKALREVEVLFKNGRVLQTSMAAGLTNKEIKNYYKIGRVFNLGKGDKDLMTTVKKVTIVR
jgi:hypothetical protein